MRVEPIRNNDTVRQITDALREDQTEAGRRRYLMWVTGIYLGRRISDTLKLKVGDVYRREKLTIVEKKTGKPIDLYIPRKLQQIYRERLAGRDPEEPLLISPAKTRISGKPKPISRRTAYRDIQSIKDLAGFPEEFKMGTHTMRKTFGYRYYQKTKDIAGLMKLYNHSKEEITQIYIGLAADEMKESFHVVDGMYDD